MRPRCLHLECAMSIYWVANPKSTLLMEHHGMSIHLTRGDEAQSEKIGSYWASPHSRANPYCIRHTARIGHCAGVNIHDSVHHSKEAKRGSAAPAARKSSVWRRIWPRGAYRAAGIKNRPSCVLTRELPPDFGAPTPTAICGCAWSLRWQVDC